MNFDINKLQWIREPADYTISTDKIEIITNPNTDLWQRTYYHFRNDNAPVLQMKTTDFSTLAVLLQTMDIPIGQLLRLMRI